MTDWRVSRGQEEQTKAFLEGFNEVLPLEVKTLLCLSCYLSQSLLMFAFETLVATLL